MPRYRTYIICANPRSGSTLLCKLLSATGIAGNPHSYFHLPSLATWADDCNIPNPARRPEPDVMRAVLAHMCAKGSAGTDIFGLRLMRKSFDYLMAQLDALFPGLPHDTDRLHAAFGSTLYIHLTRDDKIAQAVSAVKARQTGLWHIAPDGHELERTAPPQKPVYDAEMIAQELAELTRFDQQWDNWFQRQQIKPLRVPYEALAKDPTAILTRILDRLGLDSASANNVRPQVAILADETSRDWIKRYGAGHRET